MKRIALCIFIGSFLIFGVQLFSADEKTDDANSGTTTGTVSKTVRKVLTIIADDGKELNFSLRPQEKGANKTDIVAIILGKVTLKRGMKVTVRWTLGEKGIKYIDKLIAKGSMTGNICDGNLFETILKPDESITTPMNGKITDGYLDGGVLVIKEVEGVDGPVRFICRCVKGVHQYVLEDKKRNKKEVVKRDIWIPIPEEIKLLEELCFKKIKGKTVGDKKEPDSYVPRIGERVTVEYELEDHLRINGLAKAKEDPMDK